MRRFLSLLATLALVAPVAAQTSFPMVTFVHPVAIQRGQTTEVVVDGQQNFFGAYQVVFDAPGLSAQVVAPDATPPAGMPKPMVKNVKVKLAVARDAPLGVREFRIATSLGISSIGQFVVVDDPVVHEAAANNTFPQAQAIKLPCATAGKLEAIEDVDYFKFEAEAGQVLTFELFCARIQDKIHDLQKHAKPMLALFDAEGRELAANDTFFFADPMLSYTIQRTGTHFIQVRESTYDGDPRWVYALLATQRPAISHVYPMAGNPATKLDVDPIGSAKLKAAKVTMQTPSESGIHQIQLDVDGTKTNPATFIVSTLPQALEQEPNDDAVQATRITLPAGINGRIAKKRDLDHYVFAAQKGKALRFEVKARRFGTLLNSNLHAVIDILDAKGTVLASNDDSHGKEAALLYTPTADGDLVLRIRDLNSKGGESFVYFVEADHARPDFALRCDPDKAMIGPGSSTAWYVHVARLGGFTGPVQIDIKNLPREVTASPLTIDPAMTQGVIILTASPSATQSVANVEVVGTAKVPAEKGEQTLTRIAIANQEIYLPGGGRGKFDVNLHTVAVTDPSDILKVNVNVKEIVLKPGQEAKIDVDLVRRPDYDKSVSLDIPLSHLGSIFGNPLPAGVTVGKSKTLLGAGSKGFITLKAAANAAPIENVPISVLAHVSINFVVKVSYSSPPILLSVRK